MPPERSEGAGTPLRTGARASDRDVDRVRAAVIRQGLPCLVARNRGMVVVLAHQGVDIGLLYEDLCRANGDSDGVVAPGEPISSPEHIPPRLRAGPGERSRHGGSPATRAASLPTPTWGSSGSSPSTATSVRSSA